MITDDDRLDRTVEEQIAVTSTYDESEINGYTTSMEDADHRTLMSQVPTVVDVLEDNLRSRQAITVIANPKMCIQGVQVLVRERIHVLAWLRSSDIDEYRNEDLGFFYQFGCEVRTRLMDREVIEDQKRLMVHVFTSSLHREVDDE